jgi:aliphatic nitrilase
MSGAEEGLLVAVIDLEDCVRAKLVHDYSGHYNRPDVFTLSINATVPSYLETRQAPASAQRRVGETEPGAAAGEESAAPGAVPAADEDSDLR